VSAVTLTERAERNGAYVKNQAVCFGVQLMYVVDESGDFVNEKDTGYRSNVLLKETGDIWELREFHENSYRYGWSVTDAEREKRARKKQRLGRASVADEEQQLLNQRRDNFRRKRNVIDLVNCNEQELNIWFTFTYARNEQDLTQFHADRKNFYQRLSRFVQTGNLCSKSVKLFIPCPDFQLKAVGVIDFQDGERREDKEGRGAIHGHQLMNTPFLPQVRVIVADVYDVQDGTFKAAYLQQNRSWSLSANRETVWFDYQHEAETFLKEHDTLEDVQHVNPRSQPLCVSALLWEQGFTDIKAVQNMRKAGKLSNVGEYMVSKYMVKDTFDERLQGRKAYFFTGDLERPTIYRDPDDVENHLKAMHMFESYFLYKKEFIGYYIGAFTIYFFNFWALTYPWIKKYYEQREHKQGMSSADWFASPPEVKNSA